MVDVYKGAFALQSYSYFFSKKWRCVLHMIKLANLLVTNEIISFKQLGPEWLAGIFTSLNMLKNIFMKYFFSSFTAIF